MAESPPDDRRDPPRDPSPDPSPNPPPDPPRDPSPDPSPAESGLPRVLTVDEHPKRVSGWLRPHSPNSLVFGLVALVAATLWGLHSFSGDDPVARADPDTFTAAPAGPATAPATASATTRGTTRGTTRDADAATRGGRPESEIGRLGPPQRIAKVDGDRQATEAAGLVEGLVIRVTDEAGTPLPGVRVLFQPDPENGLVAPSRARTDSLGLATTVWRLGAGAGVQRLNAEVEGGAIPPVTFTATALGDPAVAEVAEPSGENTVPTESREVEPAPVDVARRTFAIGGTFVCSVASGPAACRGANDRGQLGGGGGAGFEGLATGVSHACALDGSGAARCWGANDGGQLGDGAFADRTGPVPVATEMAFSILTAGAGHTCGLASGGRAVCWGRNVSGQLGDGTREDRSTPTLVRGDRSFRNLVAGWEHTCGLSAGGELACWGSNGQGQLGDGSRLARLTPTTVAGSFGSVVAGSRHTCGISGQRVLCWGDNSFGQLGDGSTEARTSPTEVTGLPAPPTRLAAGAVHTCALLEDGAAWCWGQNVHGQLGDGTNENRAAPVRVAGGLTFASLHAGGALTCGFTTDATQYCWGLNQTGQLGDGTRDNRASPVRVGG